MSAKNTVVFTMFAVVKPASANTFLMFSKHAEYFSAFSFCLDCCVWGSLSLGWKFVVPLYCGACTLWVGLDEWLVKLSWLGKLVLVFWWVKVDLFSLECNEVSSNEL